MEKTPPDWQNLAGLLKSLHDTRSEICGLIDDELAVIESSIHYANKQLDGFAFTLTKHVGVDEAVTMIRIDLVDLGEAKSLPWSYRSTYYYAGHYDGYFARPAAEPGHLTTAERSQDRIGHAKDAHWQWVLGVMTYLNLRDTPKRAALV